MVTRRRGSSAAEDPHDAAADPPDRNDPNSLLVASARGDEAAFALLYDLVASRAFGLAVRVIRDPAQAEEIVQESLVEVWRTASHFDPGRGSAVARVLSLTHRRAVDRVRSAHASSERERRTAADSAPSAAYDVVSEEATNRLEAQAVRRCLATLTRLQHEAVTLAYYQGYTYREVGELLGTALPTIKTRMRDGLIRLRDCLGVGS